MSYSEKRGRKKFKLTEPEAYLFKAPLRRWVCGGVFLLRWNGEGVALLISFWKIYMGMQRRLILGKRAKLFLIFPTKKIYDSPATAPRCEAFNFLRRGLKAFAKSYRLQKAPRFETFIARK